MSASVACTEMSESVWAGVMLEGQGSAVEVHRVLIFKDLSGNCAGGRRWKRKVPSLTRVAVERCLRVFSWARMAAPAECNHSFPSVWSKCQWELMRCLIGSELI